MMADDPALVTPRSAWPLPEAKPRAARSREAAAPHIARSGQSSTTRRSPRAPPTCAPSPGAPASSRTATAPTRRRARSSSRRTWGRARSRRGRVRSPASCSPRAAATAHAAIVARSLGHPARDRSRRARAEDPRRRADRRRCRSRPRAAQLLAGHPRAASRAHRARAQRGGARAQRAPRAGGDHATAARCGCSPTPARAPRWTAALAAGADGIGLLRTRAGVPRRDARGRTRGATAQALAPLLAPLAHRIATVRTLDFGGDKTPPFLAGTDAASPLGRRGIRLALSSPERRRAATARAAARSRATPCVRILLPDDQRGRRGRRRARDRARARATTVAPGAPDPLVGAMIEIPAAALNASRDRAALRLPLGRDERPRSSTRSPPTVRIPAAAARAVAHHPAVLRLIARAVTAAHSAGIPVDVCGEAAGDPETAAAAGRARRRRAERLAGAPRRDAADDPRAHALACARRDRRGAVGDQRRGRWRAIARAALDDPGSGERGE